MGGRLDSLVVQGGHFNGSSENKNSGFAILSIQTTVTAEVRPHRLEVTEIRTFLIFHATAN